MPVILRTSRLLLRDWLPRDLVSIAALHADAEVCRYLLGPLSRSQSDAWAERQRVHAGTHGFCFWPVVNRDTDETMGCAGLNIPTYQAHFTPCIEIGWRFAR